MNRFARKATLLLLIVLSHAVTQAGAENAATPARPNIIFFFVDDMGWGDLGTNFQNGKDGKKHRTPELDRMAQEGVRMLRHYCPAPVCAPSRSSLLSGLHQGHANVRDNQFDKALADNHTLATVLNGAGYRSVLVGKYGLQGQSTAQPEGPANWPAYPTKRGFSEFFGYVRHRDGHQHYPGNSWPLGDSEAHQTPKEIWHNDQEVAAKLDKCFTTDLFTAFAKKWIVDHRKASPERPFFMYLAHDTPHGALQLATGPYPEGRGLNGGVQWLGEDGKMINTATGEIDSYIHPDYANEEWSNVEKRFASSIRRIDNSLGDILQLLRDLGIAENSLVVFSSDNGPHNESYITDVRHDPTSFKSYGPMDGMKRDVWEGGIRVPTQAWWPSAIPAGREDRQPSQFHDWMATFAEVAGVPVPALSDGVSLVPQLTGKGTPIDSTVYIEYSVGGATPNYADFMPDRQGCKRGQAQVLFLDGYKGVRVNIEDPDQDFEIYEVNADPGERHNLAGTSSQFVSLNQRLKERVLQLRRVEMSAKRPYDGLAVPAGEIGTGEVVSGLQWNSVKGNSPWVPQVTGRGDPFGSTTLTTKLPTGATSVCHGFLKVPSDGDYMFHLRTTGKAVVHLHQAILIDADYGYKGEERETTIPLKAGLHPITVKVTMPAEDLNPTLSVDWTIDGTRSPIPDTALFSKSASL
ncbi:MAG: sulfatase-like hydrolase/transferase [Verrucomicrobia bacterium]|nr:sulfatase-like hydrolase/transferase [Verrucomicrobiota bacterium]